MKYAVLATAIGLLAPSAFAQELPRFDAFEQQQRDMNQQRQNDFDKARNNEIARPVPSNQAGAAAAIRAERLQQIERDRQQFQLEREVERSAQQRERDIARITEDNRTILPNASEVIDNPRAYNLPTPQAGQYYARLNGRYVLVDGVTNKPIRSFEVSPDEGGSTIPGTTAPRRTQPPQFYQKLPQQPSLPSETVARDSKRVITDPDGRFLGKAPPDSYYADFDGAIYLIDARTQKAIALVRAKDKAATPEKATDKAAKPKTDPKKPT